MGSALAEVENVLDMEYEMLMPVLASVYIYTVNILSKFTTLPDEAVCSSSL